MRYGQHWTGHPPDDPPSGCRHCGQLDCECSEDNCPPDIEDKENKLDDEYIKQNM